ncbi:glycosyltransferase 87 family protein [Leifsonia sp. Leaf264]|uniref:glycosyltransferase 87 family protein n=1 Tax=Leifsonia sp. Leaf264 TaxID=1736314 RepID=UPI0006FE3487|nr:glycosyltransferase 87 family protein [Leifsonia sp. Leaf264]KQO95838.1 hypothetical protein ASF30_19840 [Leifsonia sp. Leaf264]
MPVTTSRPLTSLRSVRGIRWRAITTRTLRSRRALVVAFVALHLAFLAWLLPLMLAGAVDGDLPLYREWAMHALDHGVWVGVDADWVYPVGALLPVVLPAVFGAAAYQLVWFLLLTAANGISLWVLTDAGRRRSAYPAAWWWLAILLILSPVALLRLEGFTGPMVIVALVLLGTRPRLASALLAAAAWIKVWPAAVLLAALIASGRRRIIAISAGLTSLSILAIAVAAGGLWHVASFLTTQGSRHLQLESVLGTPWLWMAIAHVPGAEVYQDWALETREVSGPGDIWIMENGTGVMLAAVAVIAVLIGWAHRRRGASDADMRLFLTGALALATAFIVFDKVGSPQYMLWLAPIVVVGIAQLGRAWRVPTVLLTAIAVATTLVFPLFYLQLIDLDPGAATVLGVRNLLLVVLLGWTVRELWRLGRDGGGTSAADAAVGFTRTGRSGLVGGTARPDRPSRGASTPSR